jgi:hypothetical protein
MLCSILRSAALVLLLALFAAPSRGAAPAGIGWVTGRSSAAYLLEAPGAPAPPSISLDGYSQEVTGDPGRWTVRVTVGADPLPLRQPFRPGAPPPSLKMSPAQASDLALALSSCQRTDEAVQAVALFLRSHLKYSEHAAFDETPAQVFERGEASCAGFTRAAAAMLAAMGISCREAVGLKVPLQRQPVRLEGGMLHAWLEVEFPGGVRVFCDPLRSFGWVPEAYVVLRVGGGLAPQELARYSGGRVVLLRHEDRLFYEPPPGKPAVLWARQQSPSSTGALLSGKLLGALDLPAAGNAVLSGPGGTVDMRLWEGNYFFRDLEPGHYSLALSPDGQKARTATVTLRGMERRFVVSYAGADGESGPGAADEPRR